MYQPAEAPSMDDTHIALVLDRLNSIDSTLSQDRQTSAASRLRTYEKIEEATAKITHVESRLTAVELNIVGMSPTVAEFVAYKAQVQGAGKLGRALWVVGGFVLAAAVAVMGAWVQITAAFVTVAAFFHK